MIYWQIGWQINEALFITIKCLGISSLLISGFIEDDHDEKYGVPTLEELGFDCDHLKQSVWEGGETEALSRYT